MKIFHNHQYSVSVITFPTLHIMSLPVGLLRMSVVRSSSKLSQTVAPASFWKFNVNNNVLCGNIIDCLIFRYIFGAIFLKTYVTDYVSTFHFITVRAGISVLTFTGVLCCVVSVMAGGRVLTGGTCAGWWQNTKRNFTISLLFVELSYR